MALGGREAFISGDRFSPFSFKNFNYCRKLKTAAPDIFLKTCRGKNEKSIFIFIPTQFQISFDIS
jgi:hypothetical protein